MEAMDFLSNFAVEGIFCALFIWLFYTTMKKNDAREAEYIKTINSFNIEMSKITIILNSLCEKCERLEKNGGV